MEDHNGQQAKSSSWLQGLTMSKDELVLLLETGFRSGLGKDRRWPESKMQTAAGSCYLYLTAAKPEMGIIHFIRTWTSQNKRPLSLNIPTHA